MALRKSRDGSWIVDVSNGINPISLKQRRIVRKGFKTKKEALEAEQYLRSVELKEKSFNSKISIDILYDLLPSPSESARTVQASEGSQVSCFPHQALLPSLLQLPEFFHLRHVC